MKECIKCHATKSINEFPCDKSRSDGRRSNCRVCERARQQALNRSVRGGPDGSLKQWRKEHPDYDTKKRIERTQRNRQALADGKVVVPNRKRCSRCGKVKSSDYFYVATGQEDGLQGYCISCIGDYLAGYHG